jgi:hypothetical protein
MAAINATRKEKQEWSNKINVIVMVRKTLCFINIIEAEIIYCASSFFSTTYLLRFLMTRMNL